MATLTHQAYLILAVFCTFVTARQGTGYIDYYPGTLNVILSAPHGGNIIPTDIPNRDYGCYINRRCVWSHNCGAKDTRRCKATTITDGKTLQLTMELRQELYNLLGKYPHVIINKLKRIKLDANREKNLAAFNVEKAAAAWDEYHDFMDQAKANITFTGVPGIVFDIHGHAQPQQWAMLGYLIYSSKLKNGDFSAQQTSIRALVQREVQKGTQNLEGILRGFGSFGSYLYGEQIVSVPSPRHRHQGNARYFSGGYITQRHGSRSGGIIDAIQIESPSTYRYSTRGPYVKALAKAMKRFLCRYYAV